MFEVIFYTIPYHSFRGISMQQIAATIYINSLVRWQLLSG